MRKPEECRDMQDIREAIDAIDDQIVRLIADRARYVKAAAPFKTDTQADKDPDRVKKVIQSKKELALHYGVSPELVGELYERMIEYFVKAELDEWSKPRSDFKVQ